MWYKGKEKGELRSQDLPTISKGNKKAMSQQDSTENLSSQGGQTSGVREATTLLFAKRTPHQKPIKKNGKAENCNSGKGERKNP